MDRSHGAVQLALTLGAMDSENPIRQHILQPATCRRYAPLRVAWSSTPKHVIPSKPSCWRGFDTTQ